MIKLENSNKYINKSMKNTVSVQKILHFISTIINENFVDDAEVHDFWELVYLESGEAIVSTDGNDIRLLPAEVYFHKPGEAHSIKAVGGPISVFFISFHSTSKIMTIFENLKLSLSSEQKKLIYKIYAQAKNIFENDPIKKSSGNFASKSLSADPPLGSQQLYKMYLEELLLTTAIEVEKERNIVTYDTKADLEKIMLEKMISILSENVYSTVSITSLSKSLNYSRTYICTLFKKHRNTSIMCYYNSLKVKEAKKLLRSKSITEVSRALSFNNPYYFSKVFKKHEGISPSEYKSRLKSQ